MAYKLFDASGKEIFQKDLQAKAPWCVTGEVFEKVFIEKYGRKFSLDINPEKLTNKYAPDLINTSTSNLGDLKTQNTPFFLAWSKYGLDPQYTVTFNVKDYLRYLKYHPTIEIYFWVSWVAVKFQGTRDITVRPMEGVWGIRFPKLIQLVNTAPRHPYIQRYNDNSGNAKDSFLLDLNSIGFKQIA